MALFFAVALSIDALGVGFSYGLRGTRLGFLTYGTVFGVSLVVMAVSVFFGNMVMSFLTPDMAEILAAAWIFFLGLWIAFNAIKTKSTDTEKLPKGGTKVLRAFSLALMLSIDSMGAGLAAAALGVTIALLPIYVAAFQTTFLALGVIAARALPIAKKGGSLPAMASGMILMVIGIIGLV